MSALELKADMQRRIMRSREETNYNEHRRSQQNDPDGRENPFIRLSPKDGEPNSTEASYWRIIFSPAGPGHVLYCEKRS